MYVTEMRMYAQLFFNFYPEIETNWAILLFFSVKVVQLRLQWCMYSIFIIKIKSTFSFSRVGLLTRKMSIGRRANKWHLFYRLNVKGHAA